MSTSLATLSRPESRPQPKPLRRELEHYPLFGFRLAIYYLAIPSQAVHVYDWLTDKYAADTKTTWPILWRECQYELRHFFKPVWIVELPRRSRQLLPGTYVFEAMHDFIHVPGNPPQVVRDCYKEALADLSNRPLVYLDLYWDAVPGCRVLLTPVRLQEMLEAESRKFCRDSVIMATTRRVVTLARERFMGVVEEVKQQTEDRPGYRTIIDFQLPSTFQESVKVLRLTRRELLKAVTVSFLVKYDPAIVEVDADLCPHPPGKMPLGLIAHWD